VEVSSLIGLGSTKVSQGLDSSRPFCWFFAVARPISVENHDSTGNLKAMQSAQSRQPQRNN
jgi:hypothetical protein